MHLVDFFVGKSSLLLPTLPETNIAPENRSSLNGSFIFQPVIFRGELLVSGRVKDTTKNYITESKLFWDQ